MAFVHLQLPLQVKVSPLSWLVTVAFLALLLATTWGLGPRSGKAWGLFLNFAFSFLFLCDLVYYRNFQDFPSLSTAAGIPQLASTVRSFFSSLHVSDILFFLDLPLLAALKVPNPTSALPPPKRTLWLKLSPAILLGAACLAVFGTLKFKPRLLPLPHRNADFVIYNGLIVFHGYDLLFYLNGKRSFSVPPDEEVWATLNDALRTLDAEAPGFGIHKNKNLIVIQLESFESFLIDKEVAGQEVTPFLNELAQQSL
jgi:phosphoglycerol transferase MdoB-like AlkP superfamily enzyme